VDSSLIQVIAIYALPVVFAITLHEAAHGYVAKRLGDLTAYAAGRVSLNPLRHIDPIGTIALPLALLALSKLFGSSGILFGWAKPVPVNFANLRRPRADMLSVAAAGPLSNLIMALLWAAALKIGLVLPMADIAVPLSLMGAAGIFVNVIFAVLNLLPLPPLDGGRMLMSILPRRIAHDLGRIEPYGFIALIALLMLGMLGAILWPPIRVIVALIEAAAGLPSGVVFRLANAV
jgi:Zn-dependent protease